MRMRPSCKLCGFVQARRILAAAPPRQCPRRLAEADFGRPFPPWTSVVCGCGVLRARCRARRRVTSRLAVADEAPKASQGIPAKLTLNLLAPHQSIFKAQEVDQVCSS
jgi:hypothetical protein